MKKTSAQNLVIVIFFGVLLAGVSLWSILMPDRDFSETEKRQLKTMPALTADSLLTHQQDEKFSQKYETYVSDQFILRNEFVSIKNSFERLLGKKDINGVYLGADGYLFDKTETLNEKQFRQNASFVDHFLTQIKENENVDHTIFTLVPDSGHILDEKLPAHNSHYDFLSTMDEPLANSSLEYCSLYYALEAHSSEEIYYRTDHHWSSLGAYYAYAALCQQLDLTPLPLSDYQSTTVSTDFKGTYANKINLPLDADSIVRYDLPNGSECIRRTDSNHFQGLYDESALDGSDQYNYFLGGNLPYLEIETGIDNGKTLVVIKDSYAHSLIPFFTQHYETIYCIDLRYFKESPRELCTQNKQTDVLILYQSTNFSNDQSLFRLMAK